MRRKTSGFSLLELMIVLVIILSITAAIFQAINLTTERSSTEQNKLDMFQEAREFMDQMSRDLKQAGYPNPRDMDPSLFTVTPVINDKHAAAGLVQVSSADLWFEGDVDGSGKVSAVAYHLDTTTANNCPCLRRSAVQKANGDPMTQTKTYQVEVQGVLNTNIFAAFNNGGPVGLPVTTSSGSGIAVAGIDTVQATLSLQSPILDPQTGKYPSATLVTTVRINNCSQAAIGYKTSCN
jgi:prepilin-type N-terminal cleavage/methylation domain-containing protein